MNFQKTVLLLFICTALISADAYREVSWHKLRGEWYLKTNPDSTVFFARDTLYFTQRTFLKPKDGGPYYDKDSSLLKNGKLEIYAGRSHSFFLGLALTDTIVPGGKSAYYRNSINGKFKIKMNTNELELRLHDCASDSVFFNNCKLPVIIKRYRVLECSWDHLVLVKIPQ